MAICQQCGTQGAGRFCTHCGSRLEGAIEAPQSQPAPPEGQPLKANQPLRTTLTLSGVAALAIIGFAVWANGPSSSSSSSRSQISDASGSIPAKSDELSEAKHGPTATQMAGNADKWKGSYVHFPCKIMNVIEGPAANAMCGRGVTAKLDVSQPSDVDYSDPNAVNKSIQEAQSSAERQMQVMEDQAMVVLVGEKVANFDGDQIVTITGEVMGAQSGQNAMGATLNYPTVRVDYAE